MAYIGLEPTLQLYKKIDFLGDGVTTAFNLADPVSSERGILVIVGGVPQEPVTSYTVTATPFANTLQFDAAPANGADIWVIWLGSPDPDDIDLNTFVRTDQSGTLAAGFFDTVVTLTDQANIAWDWSTGNLAEVTLAGNRTLDNPTNLAAGSFSLIVRQDGSGSRTLAFGAAFKWPDGVIPTPDTSPSAVNIYSFISDGTNVYGTAVTGMS